MKPITSRQAFLLGFAGGDDYSFWRMSDWTSSLTRPYERYRPASENRPSEREAKTLVALGLIERRIDPRCDITNTQTGAIFATGYRIWLTPAGEAALKEHFA